MMIHQILDCFFYFVWVFDFNELTVASIFIFKGGCVTGVDFVSLVLDVPWPALGHTKSITLFHCAVFCDC